MSSLPDPKGKRPRDDGAGPSRLPNKFKDFPGNKFNPVGNPDQKAVGVDFGSRFSYTNLGGKNVVNGTGGLAFPSEVDKKQMFKMILDLCPEDADKTLQTITGSSYVISGEQGPNGEALVEYNETMKIPVDGLVALMLRQLLEASKQSNDHSFSSVALQPVLLRMQHLEERHSMPAGWPVIRAV